MTGHRKAAGTTSGAHAGSVVFEAQVLVAKATTQCLAAREAAVRASALEYRDVVNEQLSLARKRLAPAVTELCEREAHGQVEEAKLQEFIRCTERLHGIPWQTPCDQRIEGCVRLCVGGASFEAGAAELRAGSLWFSALLSGMYPVPRDEDGAIFIDRDPKHFQVVLDCMHCGIASVRGHVRGLNRHERQALLLEADFYRLSELVGTAVEPQVGSSVVARFPSQVLAAAGILEPLHHDTCCQWHPPGMCSEKPVACALLGTATLTCRVRDYCHGVLPSAAMAQCASARGSAADGGPDANTEFGTGMGAWAEPLGRGRGGWAASSGSRPPRASGHAAIWGGPRKGLASAAGCWTLEHQGFVLEATSEMILPDPA